MRLFQNLALYDAYIPRLRRLAAATPNFDGQITAMIKDRYGAPHLLKPVLERDDSAFLCNGNDEYAQRLWAREQGLPAKSSVDDILMAQVEHHRTEVFYNLNPVRFPASFVRRLPGSVKARIGWCAAPYGKADFSGHDLMVCNFPGILRGFARSGLRTACFSPSVDPVMATYAARQDRPFDVCFVGSFTRHHARRNALLTMVTALAAKHRVALHLQSSSLTLLAERPLIRHLMPAKFKRPDPVRRIARGPVFGLDLYDTLANSRIVINGAIDMAGKERGNIRCFEAMGTGALLLSDSGRYPEGMVDGENFVAYDSPEEIAGRVAELLANPQELERVAKRGADMVHTRYSKPAQWNTFQELVASAKSAS